MLYGLALGLDLPGRFRLRLEYDSFESKTSDDYWTSWWSGDTHNAVDFKLTVTPVILSLLYGLSPAYIGSGIGSFLLNAARTENGKTTTLSDFWWIVVLEVFLIAIVPRAWCSSCWNNCDLSSPLDNILNINEIHRPVPELPERLLTPFVMPVVFIWAGSRIAPHHKFKTSIALFGLWLFIEGIKISML
jgi:hypothetical protein